MTRGADTAAFLRALPGHGFAPPEADVPPGLPGADTAARSAAEVSAFAAEFWALPADERVARWSALTAGAVGPARPRLRELQAGTCVEPVAQADAGAVELAALVKELVALPPRARAVRRFDWLAERATDLRRWRTASRVVLRTDLSLAALEPRLFEWLAVGRAPERVEYQTWVDARDRWRARKRRKDRTLSLAGYASAILFVTTLGVFTYQAVVHPANWHEPAPNGRRFSKDEVRTFIRYERGGRIASEPYGYPDWVRARRPKAEGVP
ncbi:hypothetical protein J0H58_34755 [bacterium]|nr:hypothetical protein [bacterium]